MSSFYMNLIGVPDAMVEQTRGSIWAGMRSPRIATTAKPDPYERGRLITLKALGKNPATTLKGDRAYERGRAIALAVLRQQGRSGSPQNGGR